MEKLPGIAIVSRIGTNRKLIGVLLLLLLLLLHQVLRDWSFLSLESNCEVVSVTLKGRTGNVMMQYLKMLVLREMFDRKVCMRKVNGNILFCVGLIMK